MLQMSHIVVNGRLLRRRCQIGQHVYPHHTTFTGKSFHLTVLYVARMDVNTTTSRMRDDRRLLRRDDALRDGLCICVAEIECDTDPVHLCYCFAPAFS